MSGYRRQSAIALDRYDVADRAIGGLIFEVERRVRYDDNFWRRFRRRAWGTFIVDRGDRDVRRIDQCR